MTRADRTRGVALLNATIVILMVAALSTQLLGRSTQNQRTLRLANNSNQLALFLDAAAMLVPDVLSDAIGDRRSFPSRVDWYLKTYEFPVLDGVVGGRLHDLQSGFNLAWLRDPDDAGAEAAFERMWQDLDLPASALPSFLAAVRAGAGGSDTGRIQLSRWAGLPPHTGGLTPAQRTRLAPLVSDLDLGARINLNTGDLAAIHAFVPQLDRDTLAGVLQHRDTEAIADVREFRFRLAAYLDDATLDEIAFDRFDAGTDWFEVRLFARRGDATVRSRLILRREDERFVPAGHHSIPGGAP